MKRAFFLSSLFLCGACSEKHVARDASVPTDTAADAIRLDAPACSEEGASCAAGETCCDGLYCCEGIPVPAGEEFCGEICPISDRTLKHNFASVDGDLVLEKIASLPVTEWSYRSEDSSIRHIGPMAQDFEAAFGVGYDERHIATVDADGVSLAAIQALYARVQRLEEEQADLRAQLAACEP